MGRDKLIGQFELMVLLAVARLDERARAADIRKCIEAHAARRVTRGALYITLERLEDKGLLRWRTEDPVPGRRGVPRRVFSMTSDGLEALRESHGAIASLARGIEALDR